MHGLEKKIEKKSEFSSKLKIITKLSLNYAFLIFISEFYRNSKIKLIISNRILRENYTNIK